MFIIRCTTPIFAALILSLLIILPVPQPVHGSAPPTIDLTNRMLIIIPDDQSLATVVAAFAGQGARVQHRFPPDAFIAVLPTTADPLQLAAQYGLRLFSGPVDPVEFAAWSATARQAAQVWNALQQPGPSVPTRAQVPEQTTLEQLPDTFIAPPTRRPLPRTTDPTPNFSETSRFFIGSVAVGIVLPESDGSLDRSTEDWEPARRTQVVEEIVSAMAWWADREPQAQLAFVYDNIVAKTVPTAVEPISRPRTDQGLWIADALTAMGFQGSDYFDQVRRYNDHLRQTYQTDWAFTIFVVDSANDPDDTFRDDYFAYAYLGGPFMVMTYGNQNYGIEHMDAVAAHETGHIFGALDQYAAAGQDCQLQAGYLGVENQNSEFGCLSDEPSIMRGRIAPYLNKRLDHYARGQLGWWDSDGDGLPDPIDVSVTVMDVNWKTGDQPNRFQFELLVEEMPAPSPGQREILINKLTEVSYRVDDGPWLAAIPVDGHFDSYREQLRFTTDPLSTGSHSLFIRSHDNFGWSYEQAIAMVEADDPVENQIQTEFDQTRPALDRGEIHTVSGLAHHTKGTIGGVEFRLDGQPWRAGLAADGRFDSAQERFEVVIDTNALTNGAHLLQVRAVDSQGYVDTTPATQSLMISATYAGGSGAARVFVPMISHHR